MSLGTLTVLNGVGGIDETQVIEGDEEGHVVLIQKHKVMVMKVSEACILQTWYSSSNQPVVSAARNKDNFDSCTYLVGYDSNLVARVSNLGSKTSAFPKTKLRKDVFRLITSKGDHFVVFKDGSVGSLKALTPTEGEEIEMEEEDLYGKGILLKDEELLEVVLLAEGSSQLFAYVTVKDGELFLVRSRLGVNSDSSNPLLLAVTRSNLGPRSDVISWDIFPGESSYMLIWKKSGGIMYCNDLEAQVWREVYRLENCYDADIAAVSNNHFAVMYSRTNEDTGHLNLISIPFQLLSAERNLKTTIHKGRGLFAVNGYLFIVGGGKVAFSQLTNLTKQLDQYIGVQMKIEDLSKELDESAFSLYLHLPKLYKKGDLKSIVETLTTRIDVPEDLIVEFVDHVTDSKTKIKFDDQLELLQPIISQEYSHTILQAELARLTLDQSLLMLEIICSILDDEDVTAVLEKRLLMWMELLIGNHYVQIVLSKDNRTAEVMDRTDSVIRRTEAANKEYSLLQSSLKALTMLEPPQQEDLHFPYFIQILEL